MTRNGRGQGTAAGVAILGLVAALGHGCGGGGASTGPDGGSVIVHPPWTELPQPAVSVEGGSALSPGGQGQAGGVVHLVAQGDVSIDPAAPAPGAPQVPAAPSGAKTLDAGSLAGDVNESGAVVIAGDLTTGGSEATRTISSGGDLFVTGNLRAADLGAGRQGIDLKATGTIYVTGTIDASGAAGGGQAGGAIVLSASQIVITGKLLASGGDSPSAGGAAGAVTLTAMQGIVCTGAIEAFGGNAIDAMAVTGGNAGALTVTAGGDVSFTGAVLVRGGAASNSTSGGAQGGAAAAVAIDTAGAVDIGGTVDARGGLAKAGGGGGAVSGGAAGTVRIGEHTVPSKITIRVPVAATGGAGDSVGGLGGTVTPEPGAGSINVAGARAIDVSGGDSQSAPGAGGNVNGSPTADPGSGGFHVSGEIVANGGSIAQGGSGNGADGGRVDIELKSTDGAVMVDQGAKISADGGKAGGAGVAGGGGHIWMFTMDGDLTIAGEISVRGGDGGDSGTGGLGGMIYFFSDDNHNAVDVGKGNLLIAATGKLDASGGNGAIGGSARSDGMPGVSSFPENQETFAIFLNCDGQHGETQNWMKNDGVLIARGGVHNGNGGDITYHGIGPGQLGMDTDGSGNHHPPPGNQDMSGDGTGMPGDFGDE